MSSSGTKKDAGSSSSLAGAASLLTSRMYSSPFFICRTLIMMTGISGISCSPSAKIWYSKVVVRSPSSDAGSGSGNFMPNDVISIGSSALVE